MTGTVKVSLGMKVHVSPAEAVAINPACTSGVCTQLEENKRSVAEVAAGGFSL